MSYKVVLSHSAQDAEWAKWIHRETGLAGIEVYLFEHDPRPGTYVAQIDSLRPNSNPPPAANLLRSARPGLDRYSHCPDRR
jgi:hypothetical protein